MVLLYWRVCRFHVLHHRHCLRLVWGFHQVRLLLKLSSYDTWFAFFIEDVHLADTSYEGLGVVEEVAVIHSHVSSFHLVSVG